MCAGSGARFVRAVGAVAGVVVDPIRTDLDGRIRDAAEFGLALVVRCN